MAVPMFTDATGIVQIQGYPVGRRGKYVYHLVQGRKDADSRAKLVEEYTSRFRLTHEEIADLQQQLAALDAQRAAPKVPLEPPPTWLSEPATEKQIVALAKYGLVAPPSMTKGEARDVLYRAKKEWPKLQKAGDTGGFAEEVQFDLWREEFAECLPKP